MYALAIGFSSLPYFHMGELGIGGLPIQSFGVIVAVGVLIGAALLRRYAEWHGVDDDYIRGLLGWVTVCGFLGAHEFDMIAYNWAKIGDATVHVPASWWPDMLPVWLYPSNWPLPLKIWEGISSYGGFIGGAMGFAFYVWWKRRPWRLYADITIIGLMPAFSIGRIGCTVVSDHVGAAVDPSKWYAALAMDYPRTFGTLHENYPNITTDTITAWNLGLVELVYLIPVNAILLYLAFRPSKRPNAGFMTVLMGILYAPVRFFMDYLRPEDSDPRHLGLTFAQWASLLAFGVAVYVALQIRKNGKPAVPVTTTSGEAQRRLKMILKEDLDKAAKDKDAKPEDKKSEKAATDKDEEALAKEALAAGSADAAAGEDEGDEDEGDEDEGDEEEEEAKKEATAGSSAPKPASNKPKPKGGGSSKKNKKKRRR